MQIGNQDYPFKNILDPLVFVPAYIDEEHNEIHEGHMFDTCELATLGVGATRDYMITTGAKSAHMKFAVTGDGKGNVAIYEGSTTSANGTPMVINNRNRQSTGLPVSTVNSAPTVTALNTMLCQELFGSSVISGGGTRADNEWILKKSTKYIIRVTATVAIDFSIKINFYEET